MRKNLTALLAMAMFAEGMNNPYPTKTRTSIKREKKEIIPKGCKKYFFAQSGYFDTKPFREDGGRTCIYSCIAMSEKSAVKKFNKRKK